MTAISIKHLSLTLSGRQVLRDVQLQLQPGQLIALLGPNGAGKTSLLRCLAGLRQPSQGEILIGERSLADLNRQQRAQCLAYLEQDADCHWPMSVEDVVALGRLPHRLSGAALSLDCRQQIDHALEQSDLMALRHRAVDVLSGGERRRVMLARSLATNTPLLLTDEPVSGLDPAHQLRMMELLAAKATAGMLVIVVLHDLALAARFAQRLIMLNQGTVIADGSAEEVMTPELLAATYGIDAHVDTIRGLPVILPVSAR